jgi:hypothetical protein
MVNLINGLFGIGNAQINAQDTKSKLIKTYLQTVSKELPIKLSGEKPDKQLRVCLDENILPM